MANLDAGASTFLEVLTPPEYTSTKYDRLYLVGKTDAPKVEISLNGTAYRVLNVRDSVFHTMLAFGYGLNEIVIRTITADSAATPAVIDTVEILSGPKIGKKYSRIFAPLVFHSEHPRRECLACHPIATAEEISPGTAAACYECHREIERHFRTHIPNDQRACSVCHRLRDDLTAVSTGGYAGKNPCYSCHQDKIGAYAQDYIHGPVAGGTCTICHDPHGSEFEFSLVNPVAVLCPSCHTMDNYRELPTQHRPFSEGKCTDCHDPHSTDNKWVLIKNSQELCTNCHQKIGLMENHRHPYNVTPKRRLVAPLELSVNGQLECLSCHEAHAGSSKYLLRSEEENACAGCHPGR